MLDKKVLNDIAIYEPRTFKVSSIGMFLIFFTNLVSIVVLVAVATAASAAVIVIAVHMCSLDSDIKIIQTVCDLLCRHLPAQNCPKFYKCLI